MKNEELKKTKRYISYLDSERAVLAVPKSWCLRFGLTPTDLMIFEEIHQATHFWARGCYCASRTALCVIVNGSPPTIDKSLRTLTLKGFISKTKEAMGTSSGGERKNICYRSLLPKEIKPNAKDIENMLDLNITHEMALGRYPKAKK